MQALMGKKVEVVFDTRSGATARRKKRENPPEISAFAHNDVRGLQRKDPQHCYFSNLSDL